MFKRKKKRPVFKSLREYVWPSMGWDRTFTYLKHRLIRLKDPSDKIAAGLAVGVAMSFSPLMGTHLLQCLIICYILRANYWAAFLGTAIGNPSTFPFIWWVSYALGAWIMHFFGFETLGDIDYAQTQDNLLLSLRETWDLILAEPSRFFLPWMLGGHILGIAVWFPSYYIFHGMIVGARKARVKVRDSKLAQKLSKK